MPFKKEHTKTTKAHDTMLDMMGTALQMSGPDVRNPTAHTDQPFDDNRGRYLVWELCELNFRLELLALDTHLTRSLVSDNADFQLKRQSAILNLFPGESLVPLPSHSVTSSVSFQSTSWKERRIALEAFRKIMLEWEVPLVFEVKGLLDPSGDETSLGVEKALGQLLSPTRFPSLWSPRAMPLDSSSNMQNKEKTCPICGKTFNVRGFKTHETACSRKAEDRRRKIAYERQPRGHLPGRQSRNPSSSLEPDEATISSLIRRKTTRTPTPPIPAASDQPRPDVTYIRTEYHPSSGRDSREDSLEEYQACEEKPKVDLNDSPWHPFKSKIDFELVEFILQSALNGGEIDGLLKNMAQRGGELPSFRNHRELIVLWEKAADLRTQFTKTTFSVPLGKQNYEFDVYHRDLWSWTLDILQDPVLAPYIIWDAQRLFKCKGDGTSERFYTEPWTGNIFWEVQSTLPVNGKPICYIIYADKTRLSSFGTVQGYPVIVRLGNLPAHIRNGQGVGGGRVIGWLPIVPEESQHHDKSYYADFKRAVWHKAFEVILSSIKNRSKIGAWVQSSNPDVAPWYLFPTIMILSADYEEQCVMALTRGVQSKFPCNICLVPEGRLLEMEETYNLRTTPWAQDIFKQAKEISNATDRNEFLKKFGLRFIENVFWSIEHCDVYRALSFDRLHTFNHGLFALHLLKEVIRRIEKLKHSNTFAQQVDEQLSAFPRWKDLYHFAQGFMHVTYTDGLKFEMLSKQLIFIAHNILTKERDPVGYILLRVLRVYMELDMYASFSLHTSSSLQAGRARLPILAALIAEYEKASREEYEKIKQAALAAGKKPPKNLTFKVWDFPKVHTHKHLFDDIEAKGVTLNYNTKPNESMHGTFKESYQRCTNFKDYDKQILQIDQWFNAMSFIRQQIDVQEERLATSAEEKDPDEIDNSRQPETADSQPDYVSAASVHGNRGKGGGRLTFPEVEAKAADNPDFSKFRKRLSQYMMKHFESHPEELPLINGAEVAFEGFALEDRISLYGMLKSYYPSLADWRLATDILRCSPNFNHCPRYDFVLLDTVGGPLFAQLVMVFECTIHEKTFPLMLVRPFDQPTEGYSAQKDQDLGFYRVRTDMKKSEPRLVSIYSVLRGALLIEDHDFSSQDKDVKEYLVVDVVDADMFLRMQSLSYVGKSTVQ
ncbi:hypothetical protein EDD18DRAFT_1345071 [Armillaria luteobubalina]|uniref:Uncharacterized protein n=1 Tax=Armillaria luteobubalina TaxID=153913 RepID=A0AA39UUR0_9AGAR|nr:hypothetical protein EDD18DRAFT_1345071 [Armillaria luteobubalina]